MDKNELRRKYIEIRNNIEKKEEKSYIIQNEIIKTDAYKKAQVVALYKSLASEVNTNYLIEHSLNLKKIVCLPKVEGEDINFYQINDSKEKLLVSKFGILEPQGNARRIIPKGAIDIAIVPGVAFDEKCNRLGFGKGYYDRFLKSSGIKTIGICFENQVLKDDILPTQKHDVLMDCIITEERIISKDMQKYNMYLKEKGM